MKVGIWADGMEGLSDKRHGCLRFRFFLAAAWVIIAEVGRGFRDTIAIDDIQIAFLPEPAARLPLIRRLFGNLRFA